jgi:hypothetical protein
VEEGGRKIPEGVSLPGDLLHGRPERSFFLLSSTINVTELSRQSTVLSLDMSKVFDISKGDAILISVKYF